MADAIRRVSHFRTQVDDTPGTLAQVAKALADAGVNLL